MQFSRRDFTSCTLGLTISSGLATPLVAQTSSAMAAALAAIRGYAQADLAFNHLPGLTLGLVVPRGLRTIINLGYADLSSRRPITSDTLFQIGSITKVMVAAALHQLAAERRLRLTDRVSAILPQVPLPSGNEIQIQHLLDHVAGLPGDAPLFPPGGLWTAYPPGAHWHYSNTGYEILGKVAEHVSGETLDRLLERRIFTPSGMNRSRGAITSADRSRYAQGYEAADEVAVYARGVPLAPAPWVDVTAGAGCVGSTAEDMLYFLEALARAVQGKAALGLTAAQARAFTSHEVPSDTPGMSYGNGLMHVGNKGRAYLHHTGGMLSFSSSYHLDVASGVGAFASANLNAFAEYRPRLLTMFAVDALTSALAGHPVPPPPPLDPPLAGAASYVGRYSSSAGGFEVRPGSPLIILAQGQSAPLMLWSDEIFRTTHPLFRDYSLMFERSGSAVVLASWGPNSYVREGLEVALPASDPDLARFAGRYINDNPWFGASPVVERSGKLWIGTETPMTRMAENLWRVGRNSWSPERASFADLIDGRPQTFVFSGERFARHDI